MFPDVRPFPRPALLLVAGALLTACSQGTPETYGVEGPTARPPETLAAPEGTVLTANSTAELGVVVIDGTGYTLYRFDGDSAEPPTATCVDACADAWPPVLAEPGSPLTVEGVVQEDVGSVTRPDGGVQITIGGWPVYRYAAETAPGETGGHGAEGRWFAITPEGGRAEAS